jgi:hypothetical protein
MPLDFQEFLKQKTAGSDIRERNRSRMEWVEALNRLHEQIRNWLRQADPEGLLEVVPYEIQRGESRLGVYDAPALKVRLNADEVDVLPVGRYAIGPLSGETRKALPGIAGPDGPAAGRVDITDGEHKYMLFRDSKVDPDRWFVLTEGAKLEEFDRARLEAILQDLWS